VSVGVGSAAANEKIVRARMVGFMVWVWNGAEQRCSCCKEG
jgi:hypothetical protein